VNLFRLHPGICEAPPRSRDDLARAVLHGEIDFDSAANEALERRRFEARHRAEIERRSYEESRPVRVPLIGPPKAILR